MRSRSVSITRMSRLRWLCVVVGAVLLSSATAGLGAELSRPAAIAATFDIHKVNWAGVTLPGAACDASKPIHLRHGKAFITPIPRRWSRDRFYSKGLTVGSASDAVVFGNLAGSGEDDAGLNVDCNNGGGTADGALLYSWVIFSGRAGRLSVVGVVTPRVQPHEVLPTILTIAIAPGKIVAHEYFYGPDDETCCATGRATTTWAYADGALRPGVPVITKHPSTSPP
jgi:hypothetical protein